MAGYVVKSIDELGSIHGGLVKLAADELGVESFGMQVLDLPPGFSDYPEHDHAQDGQEEVYVLLAGEAEFTIDGEALPVRAGQMLRVAADSRRKIQTGTQGARVLAIGCSPGTSYERPDDFRLAVAS